MLYEDAVIRSDAVEYLLEKYTQFPSEIPTGGPSRHVSDRIFQDWRWVKTIDDEVVFANCIQCCVSKEDFNKCKAELVI